MNILLQKHLLVIAPLTLVSACGITSYVSEFMGGEENIEPPAPLIEIEPTLEVDTRWSDQIGKGAGKRFLKLTPAVVDERVFIADHTGQVSAINAATGKLVWEQDTDTAISGGTGASEDLVLVGTKEGEVLVLSQANGEIVWKSLVSSEVLAAPRAAQGVVIARTVDGRVFGLDATSGSRLWVYDRQVPVLTLRGTSAPVLVDGMVIAGFDSGSLVALELKTGKLVWELHIAYPQGRSDLERMVDIDAEPVVFDDTIYVVTFQGRVAAVSLDSGRILWDHDISSHAGMAVDAINVYLTDEQSHIWALDRYSGASLWKQEKLHARAASAPTSFGKYVVVGDFEGYLHWMSKEDGQFAARVRVDNSPILTPALVVDDILLAYSAKGTLVAYRPR